MGVDTDPAAVVEDYPTREDMIERATAADPKHRRCLKPGLAKKFSAPFGSK
jgi:hypothetical protein